jgi:hypothetical protein
MTVVMYGSEALAIKKMDKDSIDIFERNCLKVVSNTF